MFTRHRQGITTSGNEITSQEKRGLQPPILLLTIHAATTHCRYTRVAVTGNSQNDIFVERKFSRKKHQFSAIQLVELHHVGDITKRVDW